MQERIDPPSSLHRLDICSLQEKARVETLVLAVSGSKPVGCLFANHTRSLLYVGKLAVDSAYRGQGIARRLMDTAEAIARAETITLIELETRVELIENQRLFEHLGFLKTAENAHEGYDRPTSYTYQKVITDL